MYTKIVVSLVAAALILFFAVVLFIGSSRVKDDGSAQGSGALVAETGDAIGDKGSMELPQDSMFDFTLGRVSTNAKEADFVLHNIDGRSATLTPLNGTRFYRADNDVTGGRTLGRQGCTNVAFTDTPLDLEMGNHDVCVVTRTGRVAELSRWYWSNSGRYASGGGSSSDTLIWHIGYTIWK